MNILPHKSWHVYNIKNIEKVKKDEAKAKQEEAAKAERAAVAESEARLNLLRKRAEQRQQSQGIVTASSTVTKNVNLFEDLEKNAQNEEYVAEQKEKEDKLNRQVTMYLNKTEETQGKPWYTVTGSDEKYKDTYVRRYTPKEGSFSKRKRPAITLKEDPLESSSSSLPPSIEELRAQRLERERQERSRTRTLVFGETPQPVREETRRYHSQFNPEETASTKMRSRRRYYE
ncbi:Leukocyte receptor cluster member 1 [Apophysomyces ossiformis]|uniref:Leukocyte receptor cluster member 1 n=1 Tax=Apophysomyces ossiformis TaxID=679940 RepID=A0A8H7EPG1_9FUNG|nr:Leukocyte receptor cluster member 1 [Apophysomyces ossiformis]